MVSIPACHARDRGSIPRLAEFFTFFLLICFAIQLQASEFTALKRWVHFFWTAEAHIKCVLIRQELPPSQGKKLQFLIISENTLKWALHLLHTTEN